MVRKNSLLGCAFCGCQFKWHRKPRCPDCLSGDLTFATSVPNEQEIKERAKEIRDQWTVEDWSNQHVASPRLNYITPMVSGRKSVEEENLAASVDCVYWNDDGD